MSPFRRSGFQEEKLLPSFNVTPFPKRQTCSLDGGVKATRGCHRHSALGGQEELVHTKLKKLLVQDIFSILMIVSLFHSLKSQVLSRVF